MTEFELDVHTHTVASGHAYGTVTEMAKAAADLGLKLLGITEHTHFMPGTCDDIYFLNLKVLPRELFGVRLLFGAEINIMDHDGTLDLPEGIMKKLDLNIAGIHGNLYRTGSIEENTAAVINVMRRPYIDIISHPDDGNCPLDYEKLVAASKENHTLLEINNNSLRVAGRRGVKENMLTILRLCKEQRVPVIMDSDAHYMTDLANTDHSMEVVEEAGFPKELILNYSVERFLEYISQNHLQGEGK